jgi:hypothetical protein
MKVNEEFTAFASWAELGGVSFFELLTLYFSSCNIPHCGI